jgi:hypothetical protein
MHTYQRDSQSGAGNCTCGAAERHRRHPHLFLSAMRHEQQLCTCGLPPEATCHELPQ